MSTSPTEHINNYNLLYNTLQETSARVKQLEQDIEKMHTVMIAAAEEIAEHWEAHCDEDGYGPTNLLRRLEMGIPSQYGYTAGDFNRLISENNQLKQLIAKISEKTHEQ